jgi:hypothetical protein
MITPTEHLQLIKAECERLLAIAEKRTQGKWKRHELQATIKGEQRDVARCLLYEDATFIAACAGRAEAGWKATIAGCDEALYLLDNGIQEDPFAKAILAAWPIELLTNQPQ